MGGKTRFSLGGIGTPSGASPVEQSPLDNVQRELGLDPAILSRPTYTDPTHEYGSIAGLLVQGWGL